MIDKKFNTVKINLDKDIIYFLYKVNYAVK